MRVARRVAISQFFEGLSFFEPANSLRRQPPLNLLFLPNMPNLLLYRNAHGQPMYSSYVIPMNLRMYL
jgi:hypothetical protein